MSKVKISESSKAKTSSSSNSTTTKGGYNYHAVLKDLKSVLSISNTTLTNIDKNVNKIYESIQKLEQGSLKNTAEGSSSNSNSAAAQNKERNDKEKSNLNIKNSLAGLGKTLKDALFANNENNNKKSGGLLTKILTGLGFAITAGLAALPLLFTNTLKGIFSNLLQSIGVGPKTAAVLAGGLTPAIQGAVLGYALTRNTRGMIAGAAIGLGFHIINSFTNKMKEWLGADEGSTGEAYIDDLGNLAKGAIGGAIIGWQFGGLKGAGIGAVVGVGAAAIYNLYTRFKNTINNPKEEGMNYGSIGQGAFTGAITGAVIGAKYGGLTGMLIGLAAGGIIGGAAGYIVSLTADFKAKHKKTEAGVDKLRSSLGMNTNHMFLNSEDRKSIDQQIKDAQAVIDDANSGDTAKKEAKQKINELKTLKDRDRRLSGYKKTYDAFKQWDLTKDADLEGLLFVTESDGTIRPTYKPDKERLGKLYAKKYGNSFNGINFGNSYEALGSVVWEDFLQKHPDVKSYTESIGSAWTSGNKGKMNYGEGGKVSDASFQADLKSINSGLVTQSPEALHANRKPSVSKDQVNAAMSQAERQTTAAEQTVEYIKMLVEQNQQKTQLPNSSITKSSSSGMPEPKRV